MSLLLNEQNLKTGYSASRSDLEKKLQRAKLDTLIIYNFLSLSCESQALFTVNWLEWSVVRELLFFLLICKVQYNTY